MHVRLFLCTCITGVGVEMPLDPTLDEDRLPLAAFPTELYLPSMARSRSWGDSVFFSTMESSSSRASSAVKLEGFPLPVCRFGFRTGSAGLALTLPRV